MKRQTYSQEKTRGLEVTQVTNKRIILPFKQATIRRYSKINRLTGPLLENQITAHHELFPHNIAEGWSFYGFIRPSVKQDIKVRRIQTKADKGLYCDDGR